MAWSYDKPTRVVRTTPGWLSRKQQEYAMLNDDQRDYMRYLAIVPAEKKCWCAWYMAGECPNCKGLGTLEQRLKVQCPGCDNYPPVTNQMRPIVHRIGCTSPNWQPTTSPLSSNNRATNGE